VEDTEGTDDAFAIRDLNREELADIDFESTEAVDARLEAGLREDRFCLERTGGWFSSMALAKTLVVASVSGPEVASAAEKSRLLLKM
jgi:hypothetical protein